MSFTDNVNQILSTSRLYLDLARMDEKERLNLIQKKLRKALRMQCQK